MSTRDSSKETFVEISRQTLVAQMSYYASRSWTCMPPHIFEHYLIPFKHYLWVCSCSAPLCCLLLDRFTLRGSRQRLSASRSQTSQTYLLLCGQGGFSFFCSFYSYCTSKTLPGVYNKWSLWIKILEYLLISHCCWGCEQITGYIV